MKAYEHFNDPEWDGEPVEPDPPGPRGGGGEGPGEGGGEDPGPGGNGEPPPRQKIKVKLADGKERTIQHMMATTFWSPDGKPISAADFIERLFGDLPALFRNEDELKSIWSVPETRKALLESLSELGYGNEQLAEIRSMIDAEKSDLFDVLAYIAFALAPITRGERADKGKKAISSLYNEKLCLFLEFVLSQYVKEGVGELDRSKLTDLLELKYHSVTDAAEQLGGAPAISDAFVDFQRHLYLG